jgi:hypothetical protein
LILQPKPANPVMENRPYLHATGARMKSIGLEGKSKAGSIAGPSGKGLDYPDAAITYPVGPAAQSRDTDR